MEEQKLEEADLAIKNQERKCLLAQHNYNQHLADAVRLVPDLANFIQLDASFVQVANEHAEPVMFYRYFNVDLLVYKLTSWFGNGARFCLSGPLCDTFKFYPEIAMLTANNILRID
jgi:hypothetical protein